MMSVQEPGASLGIPGVPNLRDLGGWATPRGSVAWGVLYRSAEFSDLAGDDRAAFDRLGIATVYDLRTAGECAAEPNTLPDGVARVALDVLKDSTNADMAALLVTPDDPAETEAALGGGKAAAAMLSAYREVIDLSSAKAGFRLFFLEVADGTHTPALFHCTTGKDRTGWLAAATLMLLGVSDADVMTDYLLTNVQLAPYTQPTIDAFAARGGDPALLEPIYGVRREYLEASLEEMRTRFGGIEGYFADGLGLDAATVAALRGRLTAG
jgi:protein-tyrosine phosphatase